MDVRRPWTSSNGAPIARMTTIPGRSEARARPVLEAPRPTRAPPKGPERRRLIGFPFGWVFDKRDLPGRKTGRSRGRPGRSTIPPVPQGGIAAAGTPGRRTWEAADPAPAPRATATAIVGR